MFSGVFADDPVFVCEVMQQAIELVDQQGARKTGKERQVATLSYCGHVFDVVTSRHRLMDAAWETEILSKVSCLNLLKLTLPHTHVFYSVTKLVPIIVSEAFITVRASVSQPY